MKPTESAAPVSRLGGDIPSMRAGRLGVLGQDAGDLPVDTAGGRTGADCPSCRGLAVVGARRRHRVRAERPSRALPRRHRRLVARRPHRHHRRPPGRPRPRPLVGRHRLRRRPHPRRAAAVRLGARRPGQPRRRRPGRRRPPPPLAAGPAARRRGHPRHRRRRPRPRRLRRDADRRDSPGSPLDWGICRPHPRWSWSAVAYLARHPHPALVRACPAGRRPAHRRPYGPAPAGPCRGRAARHRPADLRRRRRACRCCCRCSPCR